MKITVLSACTTHKKELTIDKGQSLLIECENRRMIYDFSSSNAVLENMNKLGISPEISDMGYLSCGNSLCSGGLIPFAASNPYAKFFARSSAFLPHYKKGIFGKKDVSLDGRFYNWERMVHCKKYTIDDSNSIVTFSLTDPAERTAGMAADAHNYFVKDEMGNFLPDDFSHEMYLLLREEESWTLVCGSAHAGIINVIAHADFLVNGKLGGKLTAVVGAWSLATERGKPAPDHKIDEASEFLQEKDMTFYTGHTTGAYAYKRMKETLGERLHYYAAGDEIIL